MTKDEIKNWLAEGKRGRAWLAQEIGVSKGTVDQWFSKGFPEWAVKAIERMGEQPLDACGLDVAFTAAEFELIEAARLLSAHPTRSAFYHTAIMQFTDEILEREADPKSSACAVIQGPFSSPSGSQKAGA
jgi:kynurenine formamidase